MGTRKILVMVAVVVWLAGGIASAGEWWVDPNGSDGDAGGINDPFATIRKALWQCSDYVDDTIHVNTGTYETGPLFLVSDVNIVFSEDVTVKAWSITDPNSPDPKDPDDPNSFRGYLSRLWNGIGKNNIIIDGNDTTFGMEQDQYPKIWEFNANTAVDLDTNSITIEGHGYIVGDKMQYICGDANELEGNGVPLKTGWGGYYYIIPVDTDNIQLAESFADAESGTEINLTWKPDYSRTDKLSGGEYRHVICLQSCTNVQITGLTLEYSGGDGLYIGVDRYNSKKYCENITIRDVTCDHNYRNAIFVSSVDVLTIEDCVLKNTEGTDPKAGMSFEPNTDSERLKNIEMSGCLVENNDWYGILVAPRDLKSSSEDVDILIKDCNVIGPTLNGLAVLSIYEDGPGGEVIFENCQVENAARGIHVVNKSTQAASVVFRNCVVKDTWEDYDSYTFYPVKLKSNIEQVGQFGVVEFIDCQVIDSYDRPAISWSGNTNELYEVLGDIYVDDPNRTGPLYDWNGATLHNVDITLHSKDIDTCNAHNFSRDMEYDTERGHVCYSSINAAIVDANDYTEVEVYTGTHYENIDFDGKPITVRSGDPCDWSVVKATIIDANGLDRVVDFDISEGAGSILKGFTITGGYISTPGPSGAGFGGGIRCYQSSPTISHCFITDNQAVTGGGIGCFDGAEPTITNCIISDNYASGTGGAICTSVSSDPEISNCTVVSNTATGAGGIFASASNPKITNCIIWDNGDDLSGCSATYSCIEDLDAEPTNIHTDPNFADAANDDYHLNLNSPCIQAGDPCYSPSDGEKDIDGEPRVMRGRLDMGADEVLRVHNTTQDTLYYWIRDAIEEANSSDEIVVYPGTYYENVDFGGAAITIRSSDPCDPCVIAATIIDADNIGRAIDFDSAEGAGSILKGFTITGGFINTSGQNGEGYGGGIRCKQSSPTITNCIITDNNSIIGGGIGCFDGADPTIKNCVINANDATSTGGGIACGNSSDPEIYNCTIVSNTCNSTGGGVFAIPAGPYVANPTITNCIIWENGDDLFGCSAIYSCIQDGDSGDGNIATDPNFIDAASDDYGLTHGSGCIDAANGNVDPPVDIFGQARIDDPNTPNTGIGDPNYVDMGACEYDPD